MFNIGLNKNSNTIITTFLSYLPSRLLVVLNSLVIVPIFAHLMTTNEVGIFQLTIGILNLVCTCSTDWIAKSALRFYDKYNSSGQKDEFFSNLLWLTLFIYFLIFLGFIIFSDFVLEKFLISKGIFLITLFLVIPTGIRQFLYQMLRVLNRPFLYSFSIIIYQMSLLILFLVFTGIFPNVIAVLVAMAIAMFIIDFYIFNRISFRVKIYKKLNKSILLESLKYALPQILTNTSIWAILNVNKFIFQYDKFFDDTAVAGISWLFVTSILTPILSTFSFAIFPTIIKKYELKDRIKPFVTNTIQLYCVLFLPVVSIFCYFSKDVAELAFAGKYPQSYILLSFFALSLFVHELMKLFNIKYHLQNKTYIEMLVAIFVGLICLNLNLIFISRFHLVGAGCAMLSSIILLLIFNLAIQSKNTNYVSYVRVIKTILISVLIGFISYIFVQLLFIPIGYISILKILTYAFCCYMLSFMSAKRLVG